MKTKLFLKILIAVCLCSVIALTFTACKDKEVFAESSDFESHPDDWNNFNNNGDIIIPNAQNDASSTSNGTDSSTNTGDTPSDDVNSDDPYANFEDGELGSDDSSSDPIFSEPSSDDSDTSSGTGTTTNQGPLVHF